MLFTMTARRCKPTPISTLVFVCMLFFMSSTTLGFQTSTSIINSHGRNYNLNPILSSKKQLERSRTTLNSWNSDGDIEGPDRIKGCIPYMLPLLDGDFYGKYIYQRVPPLKFLDDLFIEPLVSMFNSFPFLGLILFLLFSIGSRNVDGLSRTVRFNAQQAVLIDIVLIFPSLVSEGLTDTGIPRVYEEMGNNFVYYALMSSILYSVIMNLRGRKPDGIPYVSGAADYITGPF